MRFICIIIVAFDIFPYILFIRFILYASVRCPFYALLVRWMSVRHPFCPVRVRFSYVAYPVCVRYASVTRPFYSVSTSTDSQRITILSPDNFYVHPLGVRSCYPVRWDRCFKNCCLCFDSILSVVHLSSF